MDNSESQNNSSNNGTTSEEQKDKFQFNILIEEEESSDVFNDKAHARIADSLFDIITTQEHSANIGLSGEWGSGKSTVIRMLKERMDKESNDFFFIFDSWAYENDSLRIDFLLEFIHEIELFLQRKGKEIKWYKEQAKIISGKKSINTETQNKTFSKIGLLIIFSTILATFSYKIIDFLSQKENAFMYNINLYKIHIMLFLLFLPVFMFSFIFIYRIIQTLLKFNKEVIKTNSGQHDFIWLMAGLVVSVMICGLPCLWPIKMLVISIFLPVLFYFFLLPIEVPKEIKRYDKKILTNIGIFNDDKYHLVTTKVENFAIRNYAYEFSEQFIKILNKFLQDLNNNNNEDTARKTKQQIIIVLDNLDRIATSKALELWSVMQIFIQRKKISYTNDNYLDKIWFIVPYDENAILRLWKKYEDNNNDGSSRSFLEKSFQIRIDVPKIRISSEIQFIRKLLEKSFKNTENVKIGCEEEEKITKEKWIQERSNDIMCLQPIINDVEGTSFSPRDLKFFINQVLFYYSIYSKDSISFLSVSYYILFRYFVKPQLTLEKMRIYIRESYKSDNNIPKNCYFLKKEYECYLPPKYKEELLGIIYGCNPSKGIELLLGNEFESNINTIAGIINLEKIKNKIHDMIINFPDVFRLLIMEYSKEKKFNFERSDILILVYGLETYKSMNNEYIIPDEFFNFLNYYFTGHNYWGYIYKVPVSDEDLCTILQECIKFIKRDNNHENLLIYFCEAILCKSLNYYFNIPQKNENGVIMKDRNGQEITNVDENIEIILNKYFIAVKAFKEILTEEMINEGVSSSNSVRIYEPKKVYAIFKFQWKDEYYRLASYINFIFLDNDNLNSDVIRQEIIDENDRNILNIINRLMPLLIIRVSTVSFENNIKMLSGIILEKLIDPEKNIKDISSSIALLILFSSYKKSLKQKIYELLILKIQMNLSKSRKTLEQYCGCCYHLILHLFCLYYADIEKEKLDKKELTYYRYICDVLASINKNFVLTEDVIKYIECYFMYIWNLGKCDLGLYFGKILNCDTSNEKNKLALSKILKYESIKKEEKQRILEKYESDYDQTFSENIKQEIK